MGINHDNISIINNKNKYTKSRSIHGIKGCLEIIQSLKNKEPNGHLCNYRDLAENNDADEIWLEASVLNNRGYKLDTVNRNERKGGGIALIHCTNIKVKKESHRKMKSFKNCIWNVTAKDSTITIQVGPA